MGKPAMKKTSAYQLKVSLLYCAPLIWRRIQVPGSMDHEPANASSDPAHVVVKIEGNEVNQDTFPDEGFYMVNVNPET